MAVGKVHHLSCVLLTLLTGELFISPCQPIASCHLRKHCQFGTSYLGWSTSEDASGKRRLMLERLEAYTFLILFAWLHNMRIHPGSHWHPVEAYYPNISSKLILNSQNPSPVPPLPTQLPRYIPTPPLSASPKKRVTHLHSPLRHLGHDHPPGTENSTAAEIRAAPHASQSQSYSHAMAWQYGWHIQRGEKSYFSNTLGSWGKDGQWIFVARNN